MDPLVLTLFVAGRSDRTDRSLEAARRLCDRYPGGECRLEVVDVLTDPAAAEEARVLATPTLLRVSPPPQRSVVGDLSDLDATARVLGLATSSNGPTDGALEETRGD